MNYRCKIICFAFWMFKRIRGRQSKDILHSIGSLMSHHIGCTVRENIKRQRQCYRRSHIGMDVSWRSNWETHNPMMKQIRSWNRVNNQKKIFSHMGKGLIGVLDLFRQSPIEGFCLSFLSAVSDGKWGVRHCVRIKTNRDCKSANRMSPLTNDEGLPAPTILWNGNSRNCRWWLQ